MTSTDMIDYLWGGDLVSHQRQGEGKPIIDTMNDLSLTRLLPRGTITWEDMDRESTIDLMFILQSLSDQAIYCKIYDIQHGTDHYATEIAFDMSLPARKETERLFFKNTL